MARETGVLAPISPEISPERGLQFQGQKEKGVGERISNEIIGPKSAFLLLGK